MLDAEIADIVIVCRSLTGEILAEIETVDTNCLCQLLKGQVMLQIQLCIGAFLFQQLLDIRGEGHWLLWLLFLWVV